MSINHHPNDEFLLDYSSGGLGEAWELAVATHLALCPKCRHTVAQMESIGGSLLDTLEPTTFSTASFDKVMECLDNTPVDVPPTVDATPAQISGSGLPQPLRRYAENAEGRIEWQRMGMGASQLLILTDNEGVTARLLRIPAGRPVPEHSHRGVELTLVLSGAYTDTTGRYGCGDFQEADAALEHQPHATAGEDCICLAITDAPLRFKSLAARTVQPFLGI